MLLFASILLTASAVGAPPASRIAPPRSVLPQECIAVRVRRPGGRSLSRTPSFSARDVAEIELVGRASSSLVGRQLEFRLFLPDGHLYQKVGPRGAATSTGSRLTSRRTASAANSRQATARLPVAGTAITMSSLFGTWSVVPFLDGQPAACGSTRFVIRP